MVKVSGKALISLILQNDAIETPFYYILGIDGGNKCRIVPHNGRFAPLTLRDCLAQ